MIKTKRLVIKPYTENDYNQMFELLTNQKIKETYVIPDFKSLEDVQEYIVKLKELSYSNSHFERGIYLNEILIGFVNDVEIVNKSIEIGYVIHPEYQKQGFATEMLAEVIRFLFNQGYDSIKCCAFITNQASIRVMEKCHMKPLNYKVELLYQSKIQECIYYSIERSNFELLTIN